MKKVINVFLAVVITLFSIPLNGLNVSAEGIDYNSIPDGEYEISITSSSTAAKVNLVEKATLIVDGNSQFLVVGYKNSFTLHWTKLEEKDPIESNETDEAIYVKFAIDEIKTKYNASMEYSAPPNMYNHSVEYDLLLDKEELDKLAIIDEDNDDDNGNNGETEHPGKEEPEYEPAPEERITGQLISEEEADEVYELNYGTDSPPTSAQFINPAKLLVKDGKEYVQIKINENDAGFFKSLKFNGEQVVWNSITNAPYVIQHELTDGLNSIIDVSMVIDTGSKVMPHDNIKLWFETDTLKMTKVKDKRITGSIIEENDADAVQLYDYVTDSPATSRQLLNPVKVIEFEGDKYLQIPVSTGGAGFFRSLKFNGEEVLWNSTTKPPYVIQYKLDGKLEDKIDVSMIIDTPMGIMTHSGIKLWLANTVSNIELGKEVEVKDNERMIIGNTENSLKTPEGLPNDVKLTVESKTEDFKRFGKIGDLEIAGEIYDFTFTNLPENPGEFELTLAFDKDKYPTKDYDVDIYYFDEEKQEWIPQNGTVSDGKVTVTVNHFSIYGVFAVEKEEVKEPENPKGKKEVKYTIDYVIKHETKDDESVANGFFVKPGILIERDGKTYFQAQVTSWNMIESLTYNGKNVKIVSENKKQNSAVIEMEITGDLSDEILLGMSLYYGSQPVSHNARLILYPDSKKLIENDDDVGSGGKGGQTPLIPGGGRGTEGQTNAAEKSDQIQADRVFKFNYVIYKADANEPSAADQFFVKPGYLLEKNGKQYIQLYINGWNFMNWLKLKETNKHVDVVKVEGNRALIQFEYNGDLSEEIWLVMNLTVPGVYDKETYEARMVIDQASIEEIDPEGHYIHLAKPDFGDAEKDEKAGAKNTTNNPKTGDTSQVLFYTVLLIASLIALVYQVRKQLATSA